MTTAPLPAAGGLPRETRTIRRPTFRGVIPGRTAGRPARVRAVGLIRPRRGPGRCGSVPAGRMTCVTTVPPVPPVGLAGPVALQVGRDPAGRRDLIVRRDRAIRQDRVGRQDRASRRDRVNRQDPVGRQGRAIGRDRERTREAAPVRRGRSVPGMAAARTGGIRARATGRTRVRPACRPPARALGPRRRAPASALSLALSLSPGRCQDRCPGRCLDRGPVPDRDRDPERGPGRCRVRRVPVPQAPVP
jgi:hypothetical protein